MLKLLALSVAVTGALARLNQPSVRAEGPNVNNRPIIGILTLPNSYQTSAKSYFPASYVKWIESAGARVVPIQYTMAPEKIQSLLQSINGALFTGGGADFWNPDGTLTQFAAAAQIVFNESVTAAANGEVFPLWGTCLGHELVSFLASNAQESILSGPFDSENYTVPLNFTSAASSSRLYGSLPTEAVKIFATQAVTLNNHVEGVTPSAFAASSPLSSRFNVLATNVDRNGLEFVSSMEGKTLPIYTTQYHPEKIQFEWYAAEAIPHDFNAVYANHWLSLFFVNQTRQNFRSFPNPQVEAETLIYNYPTTYTGLTGDEFEEVYFFQ